MTDIRDGLDADALRTDRYLESLLAGAAVVAHDPSIAAAAGRLGSELVRVHPSFRFEERLASRLAEVAARMRARAAGAEDLPLPVPFPLDPAVDPADPSLDAEARPHGVVPRPILVGGAVASAALSIAGAAFVAWRLSRPAGDPIDLAAKAVDILRTGGPGRLA